MIIPKNKEYKNNETEIIKIFRMLIILIIYLGYHQNMMIN
jgi:hypothetical protein